MNKNEMSSRIVEGEYFLTTVVRSGHRPYYGDKYEQLRTEVEILRCFIDEDGNPI